MHVYMHICADKATLLKAKQWRHSHYVWIHTHVHSVNGITATDEFNYSSMHSHVFPTLNSAH